MDRDHASHCRLHAGDLSESMISRLLGSDALLVVARELASRVRAALRSTVSRTSGVEIHIRPMSSAWLHTHDCEWHKHDAER